MDFRIDVTWKDIFNQKVSKKLKEYSDKRWERRITGRDPDDEREEYEKIKDSSLSP